MEKLKAFDFFILDNIFQRISDFTQKTFGITCFHLSNLALMLSMIFCIGPSLVEKTQGFTKLTSVPWSCLWIIFYVWVYLGNQALMAIIRPGFGNFLRESLWGIRLFLLVLVVLDLAIGVKFLSVLDLFFYTVAEYFLACLPLPPQKSILKEFVESLVPKPSELCGC